MFFYKLNVHFTWTLSQIVFLYFWRGHSEMHEANIEWVLVLWLEDNSTSLLNIRDLMFANNVWLSYCYEALNMCDLLIFKRIKESIDEGQHLFIFVLNALNRYMCITYFPKLIFFQRYPYSLNIFYPPSFAIVNYVNDNYKSCPLIGRASTTKIN